ncbi:EF-hand [Annulohypoxylon maeteangense]|uniref:EF-hand n=1 Tax=Annulohypoxylon maeteangense TaxID=1927788 RepID=UPI0020088362|nr:EF-hand [Annulohypoxylon maeteangense]KAI0882381.1 EF-hand [Annulohypoxylon maeteangense]
MAHISSSPMASALTRPRIAIAVVSAVTTVSLGYYYYRVHRNSSDPEPDLDLASTGSGLHRRNALRRPRRSSQRRDDSSDSDSHGDENAETTTSVPNQEPRSHPDDQSPDEWYNDSGQAPRQRTGENIVTLLFRVSEDNARRNAYVHRGCQCNGCGMVPIRGIRYRCANCADFDLCEVCESQGLHNKTHVFYKVKVPAPPFGTRHVQPSWYPGDPDNSIRNLPRYLLSKWSHDTGFERVELDAFWEQWTFMANTEWRDDPDGLGLAMDRKTFERCLVPSGGYRHAAPNLIHDRMFAFYDTNHDDLIGFEEFLHGVSYRKRKDKLKRTFDGYDIDGDGYVSRRDFLRMFRAYYVLYKQMHKDILEGLDDHMMTTTEAQQLINGRQPLSSLFGREGRVPAADHPRPLEGKVFRSNGDEEINDGKGVINEDKLDTSGREEILNSLFARNNTQSLFTESFGSSSRRPQSPSGDARYWPGVINPPRNTVDLATLLVGDYTQLDDILESIRNEEHSLGEDVETGSSDENGQSEPEDEGVDEADDVGQLERNVEDDAMGSSSTRAIPDASRFTNTLPTESQLRVQHQAIVANNHNHRLGADKRKRVHARRQLLERWKRRQFYLDEEEGALPPQGWDENQDVLLNLNGIAESSKSAPHFLSPRSRSSSKVRFAEDADDYETRSNPSTSSRSVPERWGGMEIPDAERDAGKEILYQITQQAFNELLDEIFKRKEDLAVQAAETKKLREEHHELVDAINLEDVDDSEDQSPHEPEHQVHISDQSLPELLSTSGYTVRSPDSEHPAAETPTEDDKAPLNVEETTTLEMDATPSGSSDHRDPTLPQNRPNSIPRASLDGPTSRAAEARPQSKTLVNGAGPSEDARVAETEDPDPESLPEISRSTLVTWKRLNLAEQEARERGGWGRLSYKEFEEIYREHEFQDSSRNRLDYLGSWIDFCIP